MGNIAWGSSVTCLGETVTEFDSQLAAFQPALSLAELFLKSNNHHSHILILNDTKVTVSKITDTRPGPDQPTTLETTWLIDHSLSNHADCSFQLSWFNRREAQDAYNWAKCLALNAIKDPLDPSLKPSSINFQHEQAKATTTRKWEERWHANPCTSLAYRTACAKPPDGRPHPILQAQQQDWKIRDPRKDSGQPVTAKASRTDTSTMFRFITGHAFTGEYTARFLKSKHPSPLPQALVACPCGAPSQTTEHVLLACPIYNTT